VTLILLSQVFLFSVWFGYPHHYLGTTYHFSHFISTDFFILTMFHSLLDCRGDKFLSQITQVGASLTLWPFCIHCMLTVSKLDTHACDNSTTRNWNCVVCVILSNGSNYAVALILLFQVFLFSVSFAYPFHGLGTTHLFSHFISDWLSWLLIKYIYNHVGCRGEIFIPRTMIRFNFNNPSITISTCTVVLKFMHMFWLILYYLF